MYMYDAIDELRKQISLYQRAADYISQNCQDDEEVNIDEIMREIAQQDAERFKELEERSLQNAWQQDIIDMYRAER